MIWLICTSTYILGKSKGRWVYHIVVLNSDITQNILNSALVSSVNKSDEETESWSLLGHEWVDLCVAYELIAIVCIHTCIQHCMTQCFCSTICPRVLQGICHAWCSVFCSSPTHVLWHQWIELMLVKLLILAIQLLSFRS